MEQRVMTTNIRHKIKYLAQTSLFTYENKIKSYSPCLCASMGLIPVVTALSHNSNCVFTYHITFIYISHNLYFNNNNFYDTTHQMSTVYKSCYCLNMNTNYNFMHKLMLQTFQLTFMQQMLLGCW